MAGKASDAPARPAFRPVDPNAATALGSVIKQYAIRKNEDLEDVPFLIKGYNTFQSRKIKDKRSYRVFCVDPETGEEFIFMVGVNDFRQSQFDQMDAHWKTHPGTLIGPCTLQKVELVDSIYPAWDITVYADVPDEGNA